jgi:hypothetical protein
MGPLLDSRKPLLKSKKTNPYYNPIIIWDIKKLNRFLTIVQFHLSIPKSSFSELQLQDTAFIR